MVKKVKKPFYKKWWVWLIVGVIILAIGFGEQSEEKTKENISESEHSEKGQFAKESKTDTAVDAEKNEKEENQPVSERKPKTEKKKEPAVPSEHTSALRKAETYAQTMSMSKAGIYDQLVSEYGEKFSKAAADYAMQELKHDWKENALKKAETYSDTMYMSKKGIYKQLISDHGEQFTEEEAQYAIDTLEANYKENALQKAISYQETMSMSPEAIRDQLISDFGEEFTEEEADYAIQQLK